MASDLMFGGESRAELLDLYLPKKLNPIQSLVWQKGIVQIRWICFSFTNQFQPLNLKRAVAKNRTFGGGENIKNTINIGDVFVQSCF